MADHHVTAVATLVVAMRTALADVRRTVASAVHILHRIPKAQPSRSLVVEWSSGQTLRHCDIAMLRGSSLETARRSFLQFRTAFARPFSRASPMDLHSRSEFRMGSIHSCIDTLSYAAFSAMVAITARFYMHCYAFWRVRHFLSLPVWPSFSSPRSPFSVRRCVVALCSFVCLVANSAHLYVHFCASWRVQHSCLFQLGFRFPLRVHLSFQRSSMRGRFFVLLFWRMVLLCSSCRCTAFRPYL